MKHSSFELYCDSQNRYGFRYVQGNGRILFQSETYGRKARATEALLHFLSEVREPDSWLRSGERWAPWWYDERNQ